MSALLPNMIAPVGQVLTSFFERRGTSKGQPVMQLPQPMQFSWWKSTIPLEYCTIAPGAGQALRQPGSAQCMQPSLRISHSRRVPSSVVRSISEKRISVQVSALRSCGFSYVPMFVPTVSLRSFHSLHATWQALQPMHLETSMSLATSVVLRTEGDAVVVAERRVMSRDCSGMVVPSGLLEVHQERLVLRRLDVGVADEGRQGVGEVAVLRHDEESPVDRDADRVDPPAVAIEPLDA